jgi:hypothetical protein
MYGARVGNPHMSSVMSLIVEHKRRHHPSLPLSRNQAATDVEIDTVFEQSPASPRPRCADDLRAFLRFCNGLRFGPTFETQTTDEMLWITPELLTIRAWGDGSYDCTHILSEPRRTTPVVHIRHDPNRIVQIAPSINAWLMALYLELATYGEINSDGNEHSIYRVLCKEL